MAESKIELNFELVRMTMLKQEELYDSGTPSSLAHFYFDGFSAEYISYNIKKLHKAHLITTMIPLNWTKGQLSIFSTGITKIGWKFLTAAKDEKNWSEAVRTVEQQGGATTLKPLIAALLASARADA